MDQVVVLIPSKGVEKVFTSQKEAANWLNVDKFHVWAELNEHGSGSRTLQKRGVLVMPYADYRGLTPVRPHRISTDSRFKGSNGQKVRMLDPDTHEVLEVFNSLREAAEDVGVTYISSILNCCKGRMRLAHGYKWEYAD